VEAFRRPEPKEEPPPDPRNDPPELFGGVVDGADDGEE